MLGTDPGSRHCGLGIIRGAAILLREDMRLDSHMTSACTSLRLRLEELIATYAIDVIGFERYELRGVATHNCAATLAVTGAIRTMAHLVPVREYAVDDWRPALVGGAPEDPRDRAAWKILVQQAVRRQVGLPLESLEPDPGGHMYDALGVALHTAAAYAAELSASPHLQASVGR